MLSDVSMLMTHLQLSRMHHFELNPQRDVLGTLTDLFKTVLHALYATEWS